MFDNLPLVASGACVYLFNEIIANKETVFNYHPKVAVEISYLPNTKVNVMVIKMLVDVKRTMSEQSEIFIKEIENI